jgi:CRP/FNR family transcriptional regulator, cyclic AMP receptor protein
MADGERLARFRPFDRLAPAQRDLIADTARPAVFGAGAVLFSTGDPATGCWLIEAGQVALGTDVPGRGLVIIQTLGPGDVLGWSWLVPPRRWHYTAAASTDIAAIEIDTERLLALAAADPALGYPLSQGFIEIVLTRLQNTRSRLLDLYGNPRAR